MKSVIEMAKKADDEADRLINMPGEYHQDWHDVRDSIFAALVLEEAAKVCEEKHANGNWKHDTWHECADSIRALKGAKE